LDDGPIEVEPDRSGKGDLFGGRLRLRRWRRRRRLDLRCWRRWRGRGLRLRLRRFLRRASRCKRKRHEEQPTVLDHSSSASKNLFISRICVLLERILPYLPASVQARKRAAAQSAVEHQQLAVHEDVSNVLAPCAIDQL